MEISIAAEPLFHIGHFVVTNALFTGFLVAVFLIVLGLWVAGRARPVPGRLQSVFEIVFDGLIGMLEGVFHSKKDARAFFPLVATIFLFILISNWFGLLPGAGTIGLYGVHNGQEALIPIIRSAGADLNFTIFLSVAVVMFIQIAGIAAIGVRKYAAKFLVAPWHKPYGIGTLVGLLEIVSEVGKMISFTFRLFGNVFAGEVLLTVMLHLVPYFLPLPFLVMEIFVGFIQALVFAMLTTVFIAMSRTEAAH